MISGIAAAVFAVSWQLFVMTYIRAQGYLKKYADTALLLGTALTLANIIYEMGEAGDLSVRLGIILHIPVLICTLFYFTYLRRRNLQSAGIIIPAFSVLLLLVAGIIADHRFADSGLIRRHILIYGHVGLIALALLLFSISALFSGLYLLLERRLKRKKDLKSVASLPSLVKLKDYMLGFMYTGFFLYTASLFLGFSSAENPLVGMTHTLRLLLPLGAWIIYGSLSVCALADCREKHLCTANIPAFLIFVGCLFYEIFVITY